MALEIIETTLLRGRVRLLQPKKGFHAAPDTVFLAAAAHPPTRAQVLDAGCGVGGAGLCLTTRLPHINLTGIDMQRDMADLALQNARLNGMEARCRFFCGDIRNEKHTEDNFFHAVIVNPPYLEAGTHTPSPQKIKAVSHGESATLQDWVKYAHRKLKQGGTITMIHRADRLDDTITTLTSRRWFGSLVVFPLYSREGDDAKRVIVRARKERYAPIILKAGMIMHEKNGDYSTAADAILAKADTISL